MTEIKTKKQLNYHYTEDIWCHWQMVILHFMHKAITETTSDSAMAEGPLYALVSRNSATYKTSHLKTRVSGLSCGIICRRTDGRTVPHLAQRRAVKIDYRPIALPTKYNYHAKSVG